MKTLLEFLKDACAKQVETIVLINDRTHYIFNDGDIIEESWANLFYVSEIISENYNSVIAKIKYIEEDQALIQIAQKLIRTFVQFVILFQRSAVNDADRILQFVQDAQFYKQKFVHFDYCFYPETMV